MKRLIILFLLTLILTPLRLTAQTWLEEPAHRDDGGPYVTTRTVLDGKSMRSFTYRYDTEHRIAL